MLADEIKKQMFAAMKQGDVTKKEILRVARGEIDRLESTANTSVDDTQVEKLLRKLIKSNEETLQHVSDDAQRATLVREIEVIRALLPQGPTEDAILALLQPVLETIRAAKSDGQATGLAVKHLNAVGARVEGSVLAELVKQIRRG